MIHVRQEGSEERRGGTYTKTTIETQYPRQTPLYPSSFHIFRSSAVADVVPPSLPLCNLAFITSMGVHNAPDATIIPILVS